MKRTLRFMGPGMLSLALLLGSAGPMATDGFAQEKAATHQRNPMREQAWMQKEIRHVLVLLPYYSVFDNLTYQIDGAKVTLTGQVIRPSLKSDAEAAVKRVEGVETVVNNIELLPLSRSDAQIRLAAYRAIYGTQGLDRYALQAVPPIHIIVKNGHITLDGVVANETDRNLANIQANTVPGVFSVTNNLRVEKK